MRCADVLLGCTCCAICVCCYAVQENHHCALTFQLLRTSGNLLARFAERAEWQAARRLLVEAILSTDMHGHFTLTQELQKHGPAFAPELEADRTLLVSLGVDAGMQAWHRLALAVLMMQDVLFFCWSCSRVES